MMIMYSIEKLTEITENAIKGLEFPSKPEALYAPIKYSLESGGKRVRPILSLASCYLFSGEAESAVGIALGIEMFHNFTLLHDDIMDNASMRRGRETVHVKWDENTAILSGDAMLIYVYKIISNYEFPKLRKILKGFDEAALGVCEGQQYDMDFEKTMDVSVGQYLEMIRLKTSVLIGAATGLGAIAGGAGDEEVQKMYDFGEKLGLAFQLQDDLLDTYGDEKTFGKCLGGDIASGKKTFLLIKALELAGEDIKGRLISLLGDNTMPRKEKFEAVKNIYDAIGVRRLAEELVDSYFNSAYAILDSIDIEEQRKKPLREITEKLIKRDK